MLNIFEGIFEASTISVLQFLLCLLVSVIAGLFLAYTYKLTTKASQGYVLTLALIPAVVAIIIMMVNGNVGAGVAVAGAFSLVRFRSAPGSAKEIGAIFIGMGAGLLIGMGYLGYGILFTVIMCGLLVIYSLGHIFGGAIDNKGKILNITIPENLDYSGIFDSILGEFTEDYRLTNVKTTNMGSLFKLTYEISIKDLNKEKELIDKLRTRNGNLEISISYRQSRVDEL